MGECTRMRLSFSRLIILSMWLHLSAQAAPGTVLSPTFRSFDIRTDSHGRTEWRAVPLPRNGLNNLEGGGSSGSVAALRMDDSTGMMRMQRSKRMAAANAGHIEITNLPPGGAKVVVWPSPVLETFEMPENRSDDIVALPFPPDSLKGRQVEELPLLTLRPELVVVVEYNLALQMEQEGVDPVEYMAIMVNTINDRYALTNDPTIIASLVGVYVMRDEASQPFIAAAKSQTTTDPKDGDKYALLGILTGYQKWAFENKDKLGAHDIAPLMLGIQFEVSGRRGVASTPGACRFNVEGNGVNKATPCVQDLGATFRGTLTFAHEIAHSLGAPHDGDAKAGTSDCPWEDGFLMSYSGYGTLNKFKLSPCSRSFINRYARSSEAACLFESNGRPQLPEMTTSVQEGEKINSKEVCAKFRSGWQPLFLQPDESCRDIVCTSPLTTSKSEVVNYQLGQLPGNGAPCGAEGRGRCRNGWCVGQGPPLSLDQYCSTLTGFRSARFLQANAEYDPCEPNTMIVCLYPDESGAAATTQLNFTAISGIKCNADPKAAIEQQRNIYDGVCFRGHCMREDEIQDPHKECVLGTGKEEAFQDRKVSSNGCRAAIRCTYATEEEDVMPGNDGEKCKKNGVVGICADGECAEPGAVADGTPHTMRDMCDKYTGAKGAKVVRSKDPKGRDTYCSALVCQGPDGRRTEPKLVPDGLRCGPLRRCKKGKCVTCGQ